MSTDFSTATKFSDLITAIVSDFEGEGWELVSNQLQPAYFEWLGQKHGLSAKAINGIWDSWIFRKSRGLGMFDWMNPQNKPAN